MDTDLMQVARTLAERGWLPGISLHFWSRTDVRDLFREPFDPPNCHWYAASEADLHFAAHADRIDKEEA